MKARLLVAVGVAAATSSLTLAASPAHARIHVDRARSGSVRAEFAYRPVGVLKSWSHSRIRIWDHGHKIVDRDGGFGQTVRGLPGFRALSVLDLDGTAPPEVLLYTYSGGAHCCWTMQIFTGTHRLKKEWGHYALPKLQDVD